MPDTSLGEKSRWAFYFAAASAIAAAALCGLSWLWVLAGAAVCCALIAGASAALGPQPPSLPKALGGAGRLLALLALAYTTLALAFCANLAGAAFPRVGNAPALGWTLLALAAWGAKKGPGACAAAGGVVCLLAAALYAGLLLLGLGDIAWANLLPRPVEPTAAAKLGLLLLPAAVVYLPGRRQRRGGRKWLWALPVLAAALAAVTQGVLTPTLAAAAPVPLYLFTQSVRLAGVVERLEPLLSVAMTMGCFCLLSLLACTIQALAAQLGAGPWAGTAGCFVAAAAMSPAAAAPLWLLTGGALLFYVALPPFAARQARRQGPPPAP